MQFAAERTIVLALLTLACGQCGCRSLRLCALHSAAPATAIGCESSLQAAQAELAEACALDDRGDERCVDDYYCAAQMAWHSIGEPSPSAWKCYGEATRRLIFAAQRFGRLDPARGLVIHAGGECEVVPVAHCGFAWKRSDFQRLLPPPTRHESLLTRRYGCPGLGVPLVVGRWRCNLDPLEFRFFPEESYFAATAFLRFDGQSPVLEFHNPFSLREVQTAAGPLSLAVDLSAPLAQTLEVAPRSFFGGFVEPGQDVTSRLNFLEPYQPGKVPLVLIHGLFSDPLSWADMVNDVRAAPGFCDQFQIWTFRYPTGQGFLQSAAALRSELRAAVDQLDPSGGDPALHRMVLVGHSMGGLIAKLQVTHSDELIWNRLANRPLEAIATNEGTRAFLAETCYFDPSHDVARVIFIATPHAGSLCSSALVGRGAALLVEPSPMQAAIHEQLVRDNPHTFRPEFERRFPTSIDMLEPGSPLLEAMQKMQVRVGIKLHTILGVSHPVSLDGPSDGVVSVHSALHPGCQSVLAVGVGHAKVHRSLKCSAEVLRLLNSNCRQDVPAIR